jgi:microcystin-dependent protein
VNCNSSAGTQASPSGGFWAEDNNGNTPYSSAAGAVLSPGAINATGESQPHQNLAPSLTLNLCIALVGLFPSRN